MRYILSYNSDLMTTEESIAWKHYISIHRLKSVSNSDFRRTRESLFIQRGWLLGAGYKSDVLKDGIEKYLLKAAERVLARNKDKIKFVICAKCGGLVRTPNAKQCMHCRHDWH
jgi:hypothetical protein